MRAGLAALVIGYVLSQFYRAFLAVLSQILASDLGATAADLGRATGLWYLTFAAMQIPVGWALDRYGPRMTTALPLMIGGAGGAAIFAAAQNPGDVQMAMALIGFGCAPVLMASYYIFARSYPPAMFATLAALVVAGGSAGNILGSIPLAWLVEAVGWRQSLWGLAVVTLVAAAAIALMVQNPPRHKDAHLGGSVLTLLANPALWALLPIMSLNYVLIASLRGLWVGPFLAEQHGLGAQGIGWAALLLGIAAILGTALYGPLDRRFGTRKWVIVTGNLISGVLLMALALWPSAPLGLAMGLMALAILFGSSFALCLALGRAFAPPHLVGRSVALMNMFSIGGAGLIQYLSAWVHGASSGSWTVLFSFFALPLIAAALIACFAEDRLD